MKKIIVSLLACLFLFNIIIFSGCTKTDENVVRAACSYYFTTTFPEGQSAQDNDWTRAIEENLGYKIKYDFAIPSSQYEQKINAVILSNTTPDMYYVNVNQLPNLIRANMINDNLAEIFDEYASNLTKEIMGWAEFDENGNQTKFYGLEAPAFKAATVDGKLVGIPWTEAVTDTSNVLYIRRDWLEQVGREVPKTLEELESLLVAFKKAGLGLGLGATEEVLFSNIGALGTLFDAFDAHPSIFVGYDKNGNITNNNADITELGYGFLQDEMIDALELINKWYSNGLIYSEFSNTDGTGIGNKVASEQVGIWFGSMTLPLYKMNSVVVMNPEADWVCAPAPYLASKGKISISNGSGITKFHVVNKKYNHPERLIEMINLFVDMLWGENGDFEKYNAIASAFPFQVSPETKNLDAYKATTAAIDNDREKFPEWFNAKGELQEYTGTGEEKPMYYSYNSEVRFYYEQVRDYLVNGISEDGRNWAYTRIFYQYTEDKKGVDDGEGVTMVNGEKGFMCSQSVIEYYVDGGNIYKQKFIGLDTPTMVLQRRNIEEKAKIEIINRIKGRPSEVPSYAKFCEEMLSNKLDGAGKIVEEINEVYFK